MYPSLTVLHVVLFSFFASFSFCSGVPEIDDTDNSISYESVVTDIILLNPTVTGCYCDLNNGSITVNVSGGLDPDYEYSINTGTDWQDSNLFENLCVEDYLIIVRRKSDTTCFATTTAQIADAPDLEILGIELDGCIAGENAANFTCEVRGGTAEYTLSYQVPGGGIYTVSSFDLFVPFQITDIVE